MIKYCEECLKKYPISKKELFEVKEKKEIKICIHVYCLDKNNTKKPPPATANKRKVV